MSSRCVASALAGFVLLLTACNADHTVAPRALPSTPGQIVNGTPDVANTYSNVGAFIVRVPNGQIFPICSGTLIAPTAFLTASHCTAFFESLGPGYTAFVSFRNVIAFGTSADAPTLSSLIPVTDVITNPGYNQSQSNSGDIGLLILASAPAGLTPAIVATPGLLDELSAQNGLKDATFTVAGYGVQDRIVGGGPPFFTDANPVTRGFAVESFNALNNGYLRLSQNPSHGDGGACYGDSGGPNFLSVGGQQILVAITITGDAVCRATNVVYRLDIPTSQEFLAANLP
jgi:V8-like Glu-specific endopeptidase